MFKIMKRLFYSKKIDLNIYQLKLKVCLNNKIIYFGIIIRFN